MICTRSIFLVLFLLNSTFFGGYAVVLEPHLDSSTQDTIVTQDKALLPNQESGDITPQPIDETEHILGALAGDQEEVLDGFAQLLRQLMDGQIQEQIKREAEKRASYLKVLPEQIKLLVEQVQASYSNLSESIKIEKVLGLLCQDIHQAVVAHVTQTSNQGLQEKLDAVQTLHQALLNGSFADVAFPSQLLGNPYDPQNMIMQMMRMHYPSKEDNKSVFSGQDIPVIKQHLKDLALQTTLDIGVINNINCLVRILSIVEEKNSKELVNECFAIIEPQFKKTLEDLHAVMTMLADERIQLESDADQLLKESLEFWLVQFRTYHQTLKTFLSLADNATVDLSQILYGASRLYDIVSIFFEGSRFSMKSNLLDAAFRISMCSTAFFHRSGEIANQELQKYILGTGSLKDFVNPFNEWSYTASLAMQSTLFIFFSPKHFADKMHPLRKAFFRICGSLFWYTIYEKNNDLHGFKDYAGTRITFVALIKEAQYYIDNQIHGLVKQYTDPIVMEMVEDFSMGLIKADLIDLSLEIVVPMLFLKHIAVLNQFVQPQAIDFMRYDPWFYWHLASRLNKEVKNMTPAEINNNFNYYIEYKITHYICQNLGRFWGGIITNQFRTPITYMITGVLKSAGYMTSKLLNVIAPGNPITFIIEAACSDDDGQLFSGVNYVHLRNLIASVFQEQSPERAMIIAFLKNSGFLKEGTQDPFRINNSFISLLLYHMANMQLLKHSQAAELMEAYLTKYQIDVAPFIDLLLEQLKNNVTKVIGGAAGGMLGGFIANKILNTYSTKFVPIA